MAEANLLTEMVDGVRYLLRETFEDVLGIYLDKGTSLFETLEGIPAAMASQPIGADCATLAAQVEHVRYYLERLEDRLHRRTVGTADWGEIWGRVSSVTDEEWAASITALRTTYERILATLDDETVMRGDHELSAVVAMVAHTAYHLGEIRQATCTLR